MSRCGADVAGFACSRALGHDGVHVAGNDDELAELHAAALDATRCGSRTNPHPAIGERGKCSRCGRHPELEALLFGESFVEGEPARERPESITCPRCGRTSYNPNDVLWGYCGRCNWWTSDPAGHLNSPEALEHAEREGALRPLEDDRARGA